METLSTQTLEKFKRQLQDEDRELKKLELELKRVIPNFESKKRELVREEEKINELKRKIEELNQRKRETQTELDRTQRELKEELGKRSSGSSGAQSLRSAA